MHLDTFTQPDHKTAPAVTWTEAESGNTFDFDDRTYLLVHNTGASDHVLTFLTTVMAEGDLPVGDRYLLIPAGAMVLLGPWPQQTYDYAQTGQISFNVDGTAGTNPPSEVQVAGLRIHA
jgi:hypothetical protein